MRPEFSFTSHGQRWRVRWYPPAEVPAGQSHGSAGICLTPDGRVVIVSQDGVAWEFPAGRPEGAEDWDMTLRREVREEACATIVEAKLIGFSQAECIEGSEPGLILVRSVWQAHVRLDAWQPQHEMKYRELVSRDAALGIFSTQLQPFWHYVFGQLAP